MLRNPSLLEINTRVWIKQFAPDARFSDIGDKFIEDLKSRGIEILWLMGIWKTSRSLAKKCCFGINLVPGYVKALNDWQKD
ncbi:MAG TPA: glycosidase, partial [Ignavibacteriaceae bacterium]